MLSKSILSFSFALILPVSVFGETLAVVDEKEAVGGEPRGEQERSLYYDDYDHDYHDPYERCRHQCINVMKNSCDEENGCDKKTCMMLARKKDYHCYIGYYCSEMVYYRNRHHYGPNEICNEYFMY